MVFQAKPQANLFFSIELGSRDENGDTPLHLAARLQDRESMLALLRNGASVAVKNKKGQTAFGGIPLNTLQEFLNTRVSGEGNAISFDLELFKPLKLPPVVEENQGWGVTELL